MIENMYVEGVVDLTVKTPTMKAWSIRIGVRFNSQRFC
jgi:hypothetical protein